MTVEKLVARVGLDDSGFQTGLRKVVSAAKKAALAVTGLATAAAVIGSKFEFELTKTATVAQAFGKDLEALEKKARTLGATTAFTATQAAEGMYDLASAGMTTNQILAATEHAMKLAGATGTEMSQATGLLASSIKQFGLEAEDSKRIVDTYAQAITTSQLTMERLTEAMKYAGTAGASLGWTIEETTAAVAQFANLGLEGSMAGTNLRMAMISLTRQTSQITQTLAELGLTYEDVNPETHNFGELLAVIGRRAITGKQAVDLFGSRAGLNMKRLAEAAASGRMQFDSFVDSLHKAQEGAGRANEMYKRLMDTFKGQWKIMLSALEDMFIELFDTMKDEGKELFRSLAENFNSISKWIEDNQEDIKQFWHNLRNWIEVATTVLGTLLKGLGGLAKAIAAANRETISGLEQMHGSFTKEELDIAEATRRTLDRELRWSEKRVIELKAVLEDLAKTLDKKPGDIGLIQILLHYLVTAELQAEAVRKRVEEINRELRMAGPTRPEALRPYTTEGLPFTERAPGAAPTRPEAQAAHAYLSRARAQEDADALKEVIQRAFTELEQLNAKYVMTDYQAKKVANRKEVEEIKTKYDAIIDLLKDKGAKDVEINEAIAKKALAIARKRAEIEEGYIKAAIDGSSEWWELAHEKAIAATDANNKAVEAEKEGLRYIEELQIKFADTSVERLRLQGERELEQMRENFKKLIAAARLMGDELAAAQYESTLKAMEGLAAGKTSQDVAKERTAAENAINQAVLEANQQAARGRFQQLKAQHELEIEMERQKQNELVTMALEAGVEKSEITDMIAARERASAEREKQFQWQMATERVQLAGQMVGQLNQTMDALYTSGLARSKKMFKVMKAFKIVEAIINTAAAVMQALSSWPPPISYALAAMSAAMGAAQVAVIAKSQPPAYAKGGIATGPKTGYPATLHGTEAIVPLGGDRRVPIEVHKVPAERAAAIHEALSSATAAVSLPGGGSIPAKVGVSGYAKGGVVDKAEDVTKAVADGAVRKLASGGVSMAEGGRGYQVVLHGTEAIIPVSKDRPEVKAKLIGVPPGMQAEVKQVLSKAQAVVPLPDDRAIGAKLAMGYSQGGIASEHKIGTKFKEFMSKIDISKFDRGGIAKISVIRFLKGGVVKVDAGESSKDNKINTSMGEFAKGGIADFSIEKFAKGGISRRRPKIYGKIGYYEEGGVAGNYAISTVKYKGVAREDEKIVVSLRDRTAPIVSSKSGGMSSGKQQTVEEHTHYHFDGATFMDQATLAASLETIAVSGVRRDYENDGSMRSLMRRGR